MEDNALSVPEESASLENLAGKAPRILGFRDSGMEGSSPVLLAEKCRLRPHFPQVVRHHIELEGVLRSCPVTPRPPAQSLHRFQFQARMRGGETRATERGRGPQRGGTSTEPVRRGGETGGDRQGHRRCVASCTHREIRDLIALLECFVPRVSEQADARGFPVYFFPSDPTQWTTDLLSKVIFFL